MVDTGTRMVGKILNSDNDVSVVIRNLFIEMRVLIGFVYLIGHYFEFPITVLYPIQAVRYC